MAYETPRRRDGYLKAAPVSRRYRGARHHQHAIAATSNLTSLEFNNISLLRIPIIVGQRVDVDVVVRALEVQVLALHI